MENLGILEKTVQLINGVDEKEVIVRNMGDEVWDPVDDLSIQRKLTHSASVGICFNGLDIANAIIKNIIANTANTQVFIECASSTYLSRDSFVLNLLCLLHSRFTLQSFPGTLKSRFPVFRKTGT